MKDCYPAVLCVHKFTLFNPFSKKKVLTYNIPRVNVLVLILNTQRTMVTDL